MYRQINKSTFDEIWTLFEYKGFKPDTMIEFGLRINYNFNGKYYKFLKEFGKDNKYIEHYFDTHEQLKDFAPTMLFYLMENYDKINVKDIRVQLLIAIHFLTLNDLNERR